MQQGSVEVLVIWTAVTATLVEGMSVVRQAQLLQKKSMTKECSIVEILPKTFSQEMGGIRFLVAPAMTYRFSARDGASPAIFDTNERAIVARVVACFEVDGCSTVLQVHMLMYVAPHCATHPKLCLAIS